MIEAFLNLRRNQSRAGCLRRQISYNYFLTLLQQSTMIIVKVLQQSIAACAPAMVSTITIHILYTRTYLRQRNASAMGSSRTVKTGSVTFCRLWPSKGYEQGVCCVMLRA